MEKVQEEIFRAERRRFLDSFQETPENLSLAGASGCHTIGLRVEADVSLLI